MTSGVSGKYASVESSICCCFTHYCQYEMKDKLINIEKTVTKISLLDTQYVNGFMGMCVPDFVYVFMRILH